MNQILLKIYIHLISSEQQNHFPCKLNFQTVQRKAAICFHYQGSLMKLIMLSFVELKLF